MSLIRDTALRPSLLSFVKLRLNMPSDVRVATPISNARNKTGRVPITTFMKSMNGGPAYELQGKSDGFCEKPAAAGVLGN